MRRTPRFCLIAVWLGLATGWLGLAGARVDADPAATGPPSRAAGDPSARDPAVPWHIGVLAGVGARIVWGPGRYLVSFRPDDPAVWPAVVAAVVFPTAEHLAVGARAGVAAETYGDGYNDCRLWSVDLALALHYVSPRFSVGPWLGRHISRLSSGSNTCGNLYFPQWSDNFTSYGATAAVDVVARDGLHLAVFVDAQTATGNRIGDLGSSSDKFNYRAITAGIAYRR